MPRVALLNLQLLARPESRGNEHGYLVKRRQQDSRSGYDRIRRNQAHPSHDCERHEHRCRCHAREGRPGGRRHPGVPSLRRCCAFVRCARRVVALVDHSKFGVETLVQFARLDQLDAIVTDRAPEGEVAEALAEAGVEVVEAGA